MQILTWVRNVRLVDTPLRRRRLELGLTQAELARRCRIWWNTLARYERGVQVPVKHDVLQRVMEQTGLSADALIFPERYLQEHPDFLPQFSTPRSKRGRPPRT